VARKDEAVKTFKNKNYTKRDFECSNIVCCTATTAPGPQWVECAEAELFGLQKLWITGEVRFYGFL
jgi:hypothetical protein